MTQPILARRNLLTSLLAAPFVITTPGLLMPVRRVLCQDDTRCYKAINGVMTVPARDYPIILQWYNNMGEQAWLRWSVARGGSGSGNGNGDGFEHSPLTIVRGA